MLNTCPQGHKFNKTSDCPTCPTCEEERKPKDNFLSKLGAPARRALENEGITTTTKLSNYSISEIMKLHGIGKASIPTLTAILEAEGLSFRK